MRRPCEARCQQGTTLVELVITIVIISIAIAGVAGAFSLIAGRSADPLNQTRAVSLAQLYMDEILSKSFADKSRVGGGPVDAADADCGNIGPDSESRSSFNDVDDYHNPLDAAPQNSEQDPLTGYDGFLVTITVDCAGTEVGLVNHEAKRIDITVTDPSGGSYVFSAYRGNF